MKNSKVLFLSLAASGLMLSSCEAIQNASKTEKGTAIGVATGAAAGAVIGKFTGNTALGAIIGAAVGGGAGNIIGRKMDKQAEAIKAQVPDAKVERVEEGIVVEFSSNVLFGYDKSDLTNASKSTLKSLIQVLNVYPDTNLEIDGHTDSKGSDSYNQKLSVRRAGAVANYLKANGVAAERITTKGWGESAPKYSNDTEEGRAQNRRVEFLITANEKMKAEAKAQAGE